MATPAGTHDFGAIVLPVPIPLLYLCSLSTSLLENKHFYRRKAGLTDVDGRIDRQEEQDLRIL